MLFSEPATLRPVEVLQWRTICGTALEGELSHAIEMVGQGKLPSEPVRDVLTFVTSRDVMNYFEGAQRELELSSTFAAIAAMEAKLRLDALRRAAHPARNGDLGIQLQRLFASARKNSSVPLNEGGILSVWRSQAVTLNAPSLVQAIGGFASWLATRHWIAHGRYWSAAHDPSLITCAAATRVVDGLIREMRVLCAANRWPAFPATGSTGPSRSTRFSSRK